MPHTPPQGTLFPFYHLLVQSGWYYLFTAQACPPPEFGPDAPFGRGPPPQGGGYINIKNIQFKAKKVLYLL